MGRVKYESYEELENDFVSGKLHAIDVKKTVAREINKLLEPARKDLELKKLYRDAYV